MINCEFENGNKASLRHVTADNLVIKDDKILLVKRAERLLEGGKWGLVGGFVDRDETIKEAVVREIMEETGYEVQGITLLRIIDAPSRPNNDRQDITFVHFCTALEKVGVPDDESDQQEWFPLAAMPPASKIAFEHLDNIKLYMKYLKNPFVLPIFESGKNQ